MSTKKLDSLFSITRGAPQDTGLFVKLPEAREYLITGAIRTKIAMRAGLGRVNLKLCFDDGSDVPDSEAAGVQGGPGWTVENSPVNVSITTTAPNTIIRLFAGYEDVTTGAEMDGASVASSKTAGWSSLSVLKV